MIQSPASSDAFSAHDHADCQSNALAAAEDILREQGARLTPVRRRTLEILLESHHALGAYDVLDRLAASGFGNQPPVAYRALDFLVEHGLAHRLQRLNAFAACSHPRAAHTPVFLICQSCKKVAETVASSVRSELDDAAKALGFNVDRVTIEAAGLCPSCAKQAG